MEFEPNLIRKSKLFETQHMCVRVCFARVVVRASVSVRVLVYVCMRVFVCACVCTCVCGSVCLSVAPLFCSLFESVILFFTLILNLHAKNMNISKNLNRGPYMVPIWFLYGSYHFFYKIMNTHHAHSPHAPRRCTSLGPVDNNLSGGI